MAVVDAERLCRTLFPTPIHADAGSRDLVLRPPHDKRALDDRRWVTMQRRRLCTTHEAPAAALALAAMAAVVAGVAAAVAVVITSTPRRSRELSACRYQDAIP